MKETWQWVQIGIAATGGFFGWFLGGVDGLIHTLLIFVVVDYVTGVLRAVLEKKVSSQIGAEGIAKKITIFLIVGIAHMLDVEILGRGNILRDAAIFFYISNEGISLIENAVQLGLPVPQKLRNLLEQLHDKGEKEDDSK